MPLVNPINFMRIAQETIAVFNFHNIAALVKAEAKLYDIPVALHVDHCHSFETIIEQNPDDWWYRVCTAIIEVLTKGNVNPKDIAGIGVDGQSWAALPVDKNGIPLHNAMIWIDR